MHISNHQPETEGKPDYTFKVVAIGAGGVGKTSLIRRFAHNKFSEPYFTTIGFDLTTQNIILSNEKVVRLVCLDTGGQEWLGGLRPTYYVGARGAFLAFDVTCPQTLEQIPFFIRELATVVKKNVPMVLVANKVDLEEHRKVTKDQALEFLQSQNLEIPYYETSALTGHNVNDVFYYLAEHGLKLALPKQKKEEEMLKNRPKPNQ